MLPLRLRAVTNRRTVGWSELFRLDGNDEINQAGRFRVFAVLSDADETKMNMGKA